MKTTHHKNTKHGRFWKSAVILAVLLAVIVVQGCSPSKRTGDAAEAAADKPTVLNYGYIGINKLNVPSSGAEGWGFHKGIIQEELKKHGITQVNLTGFPNGPDQTESLVSGRLDAGSLGDTPAIIAYASGAKTRLISQPSTYSIGYLFAKKGGAESIKDLEGKTIAIQKGSFMHRYVVGLLKQEGVKDYKLVHMLIPDAQAALARGDVDALTNNGVQAMKQIDEGYPLLDDATKHPDLIGTSATVVSDAFFAKFPDFPKIWNEARKKALDDLKQHEEEYYQFVADAQGTTPDIIKKISPISEIKDTPFTDDGLKLIEGTKDFLVEEKLAKKDFDLNDWVLK